MSSTPNELFSYKPFWPKKFLPVHELPMTREEMDLLGWDSCDVILVTGDAFVDHPSFGAAVIGRLLESHGFRVGILSQPDWKNDDSFLALGRPNLFFGITAGNMDSMVNKYTADRKVRSDDAYTPDGVAGKRPDKATIVYANTIKKLFHHTPIILGGIEASMRRIAYWDYWSNKVRRSILLDAQADLLLYGNAERAVVEVAHRLAKKEPISAMRDIRGTVFADMHELPDEWHSAKVLELPSFSNVAQSPILFQESNLILFRESNPHNAAILVQDYDNNRLVVMPPPLPLSTQELDGVYELPYTRQPHSLYGEKKIPAFEMIRHSVTILRGCFGGCTFCSITAHEGRIIQSRSTQSILQELELIRDQDQSFHGFISDLGGPTANMYQMNCSDPLKQQSCKKLSCLHPQICPHLQTDHKPLRNLYQQARELEGIKKVFVASGLRYDLALRDREYIRDLAKFHTGGYLKVAPEHSDPGVLESMFKPSIDSFEEFSRIFLGYSREAGLEQYLIPYFIAGFPGAGVNEMFALMQWLKKNRYRPRQVQNFLPTPLTLATSMYFSEHGLKRDKKKQFIPIAVAKSASERKLHKAFLQYFKPENQKIIDRYNQISRDEKKIYLKKHK